MKGFFEAAQMASSKLQYFKRTHLMQLLEAAFQFNLLRIKSE
jgi:hypothetical protein